MSVFNLPGAAALAAAILLTSGAPASAAGDPRSTEAESDVGGDIIAPERDLRRYCVIHDRADSRIKGRTCRTRSEWIHRTGIDPAVDSDDL